MKILFVMDYPGYLRYFDSTVRLLAERGHSVCLAFDNPLKQSEGAEALSGANERIIWLGEFPKRADVWHPVARRVRGAIDYVRYLDPRFANAHYLRRRMQKVLPGILGFLAWFRTLPTPVVRAMIRCLLLLERAIPSSSAIEDFITAHQPNAVLVTPLVNHSSMQVDIIKSAKRLGLATGLCVASWDHLTTKGLIRLEPDLVTVWNEIQKSEAVELHDIPPSKVVVTGAQPFDRWFDRQPSTTREAFCRKVGLPPERPFLLFVGSTASISAPEAEVNFVRRWIQVIRHSEHSALSQVGVLIRAHPYNSGAWERADLSDLGNVAVWPRNGSNPANEKDRADYFDSLYHSAAIVGINTSAMIEAAILGRPVHTILEPAFRDTQGGTVHFHYLLPENGGFLRVAETWDDHLRQVSHAITRRDAVQEETARFLISFVRPHGLENPAAPILADAIERLGRIGPVHQEHVPIWLYPMSFLLRLWGIALVYSRRRHMRMADEDRP